MDINEDEYLAHYGTLHKSGRYPWGSGETQSARNRTFLGMVEDLRKQGLSEPEIARGLGIVDKNGNPSTTELRALKSIALNQQKLEQIGTAQKLHDKGMSNSAIGRQMGLNESSVRNLLAPGAADRANILQNTSDMLKREIEKKDFIDVGAHVENQLGISADKLKVAVAMLKEEGYKMHYIKVQQLGTGEFTTVKVLSKPDVPWKTVNEAAQNGAIHQIQEHTYDGGRTGFFGIQPPINISSSRIGINYAEHGGDKADGVIYVRPGVHDLDMGKAHYAQVRIAVDGTHYLKGMAIYKDDLPKGVDLVFNTNKSNSGNKLDAMKPLKRTKDGEIDNDNPFGAIVRQLPKYDEHGIEIKNSVRSAMNIVNEEGQWDKWSRTLSTQFLSKQSPQLAREQLDMTYERKKMELDEILSLSNPTVKKKLLESYADDADSSAIKMKAQALPRQRAQVILPVNSLKDNEIYAPNFRPGERVVLIRHPHGGTFEIPELVVTDKNPEARALIGPHAKDAVAINHNVAKRLSGADFDGDTVLVIPNNAGRIKTDRPLEGLKDFDPQRDYKPYDGMKTIDGGTYNAATKSVDYGGKSPKGSPKQHQMGLVSNLITDMTIKGASTTELAAAVRHSMVVIDAEKHHLDYKRSAQENGIPSLMKKYQGGRSTGGSSTLISRAKSTMPVDKRVARPAKEGGGIDPLTGKKVFKNTGESYIDARTGKLVVKKQHVSKLLEANSAHDLVSTARTPIEIAYANHSDRVRELGNQARKAMVNTKPTPYSPQAKSTYAPQVHSLNSQLNEALKNAPRERQAQVLANHIVSQKRQAYPDMEKADLKKVKAQALAEARARTGAGKTRIHITDEEWAAIQAGAISTHNLQQILSNADLDRVKALATPRTPRVMTDAKITRAKSMLDLGYTQADVAAQLGVPLSTLKSAVFE